MRRVLRRTPAPFERQVLRRRVVLDGSVRAEIPVDFGSDRLKDARFIGGQQLHGDLGEIERQTFRRAIPTRAQRLPREEHVLEGVREIVVVAGRILTRGHREEDFHLRHGGTGTEHLERQRRGDVQFLGHRDFRDAYGAGHTILRAANGASNANTRAKLERVEGNLLLVEIYPLLMSLSYSQPQMELECFHS